MKLLRETIRRLIQENQEHYDKLALLLLQGGDSVPHAIELAETLGYLEVIYSNSFPLVYGSGTLFKYGLRPNPEFRNAILSAHQDSMSPLDIFFHSDGDISIQYETQG